MGLVHGLQVVEGLGQGDGVVQAVREDREYRGGGKLGTGEIWHNKSYAVVFEGPKSFLWALGMHIAIVPNNKHPEASRK